MGSVEDVDESDEEKRRTAGGNSPKSNQHVTVSKVRDQALGASRRVRARLRLVAFAWPGLPGTPRAEGRDSLARSCFGSIGSVASLSLPSQVCSTFDVCKEI